MKRLHLYVLAGLLTAIGGGFFLYKLFVLGFPLQPETRTDVWRIEVQIRFEAAGGPVKAGLYLPRGRGNRTIVAQSPAAPCYAMLTEPRPARGLAAIYSIREAGGL